MAFGLTKTPSIFQHLMNNMFHKFSNTFIVYYVENILVYFKNTKKHEEHVKLMLQKL